MICIDASLAVKWILIEEGSELAEAIYATNRAQGLIAPAFMPAEVTNAIRRRVARGLMEHSVAEVALTRFLRFRVQLAQDSQIHMEALRLAHRFDRPAAYDMHYVALAQIAECDLWTADERLVNALGGRLDFVKALGAYRADDR
jgi:predicted nucleic acid-binding protein